MDSYAVTNSRFPEDDFAEVLAGRIKGVQIVPDRDSMPPSRGSCSLLIKLDAPTTLAGNF